MTYGQVRDHVLKLLDQYSVAGTKVADSYNNQADYLAMMVTFMNDAITEIATTYKKIPTVLSLDACHKEELGEDERAMVRYTLPDDFYQFKSGDTVITDDGKILHTNRYSIQGKKYLIVPKREVGNYTITYYRYPNLLPEDAKDYVVLDNDPETHFAVAFYTASMLVSHDEPFLTQLFLNKYEDKLMHMAPDITSEVHQTRDAYRFYI